MSKMRRRVSSQKETGFTTRCSLPKCVAVFFAFKDGQAIQMRPDPSIEKRITIVKKMLRRNRRAEAWPMRTYHGNTVLSGNVFQNDLQSRNTIQNRQEDRIDKRLLSIENVDLWAWKLAVHEQRHAAAGHCLEYRLYLPDIGHASRRIGGGVRWIELRGGKYSVF